MKGYSRTGTSPSDGLVSYPEHLLRRGRGHDHTSLQRCRWHILQIFWFYCYNDMNIKINSLKNITCCGFNCGLYLYHLNLYIYYNKVINTIFQINQYSYIVLTRLRFAGFFLFLHPISSLVSNVPYTPFGSIWPMWLFSTYIYGLPDFSTSTLDTTFLCTLNLISKGRFVYLLCPFLHLHKMHKISRHHLRKKEILSFNIVCTSDKVWIKWISNNNINKKKEINNPNKSQKKTINKWIKEQLCWCQRSNHEIQ